MASFYNMDDVAGLLFEFEITGGALDDQELLTAIHRPCQQMVLRTIDGEAFASELFMVLLQHDCEDEQAEPYLLELSPSEIPYEEDENACMSDADRDAYVGPIQDLSTLPAVTTELLVGLYAEVTHVLQLHAPAQEAPNEEAA